MVENELFQLPIWQGDIKTSPVGGSLFGFCLCICIFSQHRGEEITMYSASCENTPSSNRNLLSA